MGTNRWRGDAPAVAQVNTLTPGSVTIGNTFTATINSKSVTYTAAAATVADVVTGLTAALQTSTIPEFQEVTWAAGSGIITGTASTPGKPFTQTSSAATGTGTPGATLTTGTTTASSGPNDWSIVANWSLGTVPVTGDDVYFDKSAQNCWYGLNQVGVTLNSLTISGSFTGQLGLPLWTGTYQQYRGTYLQIGATTITIGAGQGQGSGLIRINTGAIQTALSVQGSANSAETGAYPVQWYGTHASNTVQVTRGQLGISVGPSETATVATLQVGYQSNQTGDATVFCGAGTTLTTISKSGGSLTLNSGATTITQTAGSMTVTTGNVTTWTVNGGTANYNGTGTITTLNVGNAGTFNCTQDLRTRTVTNANIYKGGAINDPFATVAWTTGIQRVQCRESEVAVDVGENRKASYT